MVRAFAGDSTMTSLRPELTGVHLSVSVRPRAADSSLLRRGDAHDGSARAALSCNPASHTPSAAARGGPHDLPVGLDPGPVPHGEGALPDEHAEAVEGPAPARLGGPQERGARRRDDDVGDDEALPQAVEVDRDQRVGVAEAHRGRVDDDVGVAGHGIRLVPDDGCRGHARPGGDDAGELGAAPLGRG